VAPNPIERAAVSRGNSGFGERPVLTSSDAQPITWIRTQCSTGPTVRRFKNNVLRVTASLYTHIAWFVQGKFETPEAGHVVTCDTPRFSLSWSLLHAIDGVAYNRGTSHIRFLFLSASNQSERDESLRAIRKRL
jgi:hypothetical protein